MLYVQLSGVLFDRPSRERVTETVGVNLTNAGSLRQSAQHLLEAVGLERDAEAEVAVLTRRREERPWLCAACSPGVIGGKRPSGGSMISDVRVPSLPRSSQKLL